MSDKDGLEECQTCRHWCDITEECRVNPPMLFLGDPVGRWPDTKPNDWCSAWKPFKLRGAKS